MKRRRTRSSLRPLQQQAGVLVRRLGVVAVIVAIALFGLSLARGEPWTRALLGAVSLAMAAIPAEFPIVLTLFLSAGAWRLASRGMLVRRLASVETLGSTTVICTDKTGTLTRGEFQMTRHLALAPAVSEQDVLLACERHPTDAMERAIGAYAAARGVLPANLDVRWTPVRDYDFDSVGKHMSHVWQALDHDDYMVAAKGALEGILAHSQVDDSARRAAIDANRRLAAQGLRVLRPKCVHATLRPSRAAPRQTRARKRRRPRSGAPPPAPADRREAPRAEISVDDAAG